MADLQPLHFSLLFNIAKCVSQTTRYHAGSAHRITRVLGLHRLIVRQRPTNFANKCGRSILREIWSTTTYRYPSQLKGSNVCQALSPLISTSSFPLNRSPLFALHLTHQQHHSSMAGSKAPAMPRVLAQTVSHCLGAIPQSPRLVGSSRAPTLQGVMPGSSGQPWLSIRLPATVQFDYSSLHVRGTTHCHDSLPDKLTPTQLPELQRNLCGAQVVSMHGHSPQRIRYIS